MGKKKKTKTIITTKRRRYKMIPRTIALVTILVSIKPIQRLLTQIVVFNYKTCQKNVQIFIHPVTNINFQRLKAWHLISNGMTMKREKFVIDRVAAKKSCCCEKVLLL